MKKVVIKVLIVIILLALIVAGVVIFVKKILPNYQIKDDGKISLIINNNQIQPKRDVFVENNIIYISKEDVSTYFDIYLTVDEQNNKMITTYDKHIAVMPIGENRMLLNGVETSLKGGVINKNGSYYLPFSEMTIVYDIDIKYIESNKNVVIDSYSRSLKQATAQKNLNVKWKVTNISATLDKVKKGENVIVIDNVGKWTKIRTERGEIGYVKSNGLADEKYLREEMTEDVRTQKISMLFDYYSDYGVCPDRTGEKFDGVNVVSPAFFSLVKLGQGELVDKVGKEGLKYIEWARDNNYEVWAMVQNDGMIETTHEILNDYNLRNDLIERIVNYAIQYKLDGINIDFENIYLEDKDKLSRFIIELYPRLKDYGITLSVDVTAPDGSENWSLCYDRLAISKNCDYVVFMAYDQYGDTKVGTTAGYDWVKTSLDKFTSQTRENVKNEKIILGIPFYTKLWKDDSPVTVDMNSIDNVIPSDAKRVWDDELKQYYVEFEQKGVVCKMWIEDEKSIGYKLDLINEYNLAGAAYWESDRETEGIWSVVKAKLGL